MNKLLIFLLAFAAALTMRAETVEGVTVTSPQGDYRFEISRVSLVTFGDKEMTITASDDTTVAFPNAEGWTLTFGEVTMDAITTLSPSSSPIQVFNVAGIMVWEGRSLTRDALPKGVYVIVCNGKKVKIQL
ncbi:MAG: hypothetical protein HUK01_09770 [Bacteroidaceae bacterium]|nr:hypothetical protein [Bacteroidaceae bacterium]